MHKMGHIVYIVSTLCLEDHAWMCMWQWGESCDAPPGFVSRDYKQSMFRLNQTVQPVTRGYLASTSAVSAFTPAVLINYW